jgi:hypothetical protein
MGSSPRRSSGSPRHSSRGATPPRALSPEAIAIEMTEDPAGTGTGTAGGAGPEALVVAGSKDGERGEAAL